MEEKKKKKKKIFFSKKKKNLFQSIDKDPLKLFQQKTKQSNLNVLKKQEKLHQKI